MRTKLVSMVLIGWWCQRGVCEWRWRGGTNTNNDNDVDNVDDKIDFDNDDGSDDNKDNDDDDDYADDENNKCRYYNSLGCIAKSYNRQSQYSLIG